MREMIGANGGWGWGQGNTGIPRKGDLCLVSKGKNLNGQRKKFECQSGQS